jgi:hypothetical protein
MNALATSGVQRRSTEEEYRGGVQRGSTEEMSNRRIDGKG